MPVVEERTDQKEKLSTVENEKETKVTIDKMYAYVKDETVFIRVIWLPTNKVGHFSESGCIYQLLKFI